METRRIETLSRLPSLLDFPGAKQIGRIHRERQINGKRTAETVCFITSLSRLHANAAALLKLARSHWSIENGVHYVRDVAFGEDACTVTTGSAPQVLAALRNASLALIQHSGFQAVTRALRRFAAHPLEAVALLKPEQQHF